MTGRTLGHYEILSAIGKGGMGEVWKAKDTKLGRDVAIKTLPEEFAKDGDRLARFEREAKLLASLNHPNIAAIYGLEESNGTRFLVLELVEGDTLADRIRQGALPVEESLRVALQIAEALEAAHEKGVIHRDLKPANIKVTPEGKVKVLDFGLAKAFAGDEGDISLSNSPTLSMAATQQGIILGTASYMSPEQARGNAADVRSDIWSFGCVLFEMLTGSQTFAGPTISDIVAGVLAREPQWDTLPANLHPRIRFLLERCLEKESKDRYHGIDEARLEIQKVQRDPSGVLVQPVAKAESVEARSGSVLPWVAAIVLAMLLGAAGVWFLSPAVPSLSVSRSRHVLPEGRLFQFPNRLLVAISPDGRSFVYNGADGLYLRFMNELDDRLIPGTEGVFASPTFSPDGEWLAFWSQADSQLKKIAVVGGAAVTLTATGGNPNGISWDVEDRILYGGGPAGIWSVSADGGEPELIVPPLEGGNPSSAQLLADQNAVLFDAPGGQIGVHSLDSGESRLLFPGNRPRYVSTGHIVYGLEGALYAVPFDTGSLEVTGGPVPMVEGVQDQFGVSESGSLVYALGDTLGIGAAGQFPRTFTWVYREDGREESVDLEPQAYQWPRISPDGRRLAVVFGGEGGLDVWVTDLERPVLSRVTTDPAGDRHPYWTPDSERIVFESVRGENTALFSKAADGRGPADLVFEVDPSAGINLLSPGGWSSDGSTLVLAHAGRDGFSIGSLSPEGDAELVPLLRTEAAENAPAISPDGEWIAYESDDAGQYDAYVERYPSLGNRVRISVGGGRHPLWSPDGSELYYRTLDGATVMVASLAIDDTGLRAIGTRELFSGDYFAVVGGRTWDLHPDGERFLMMKAGASGEGTAQGQIVVVENWFEELKERVPVP